jgi:type II secretory pathway component PulK
LILVLMVVGILGLLSLQMGLSAKEHVARADRLQARTEALLRLQSSEAALVFSLLTEPWVTVEEGATDNPYVAGWNFRGEPFEVDGIRYAIQDVKGLLVVPQATDSALAFERLLRGAGIESARVRRIVDALRAEQDPKFRPVNVNERPVPWQSLDELRGLGGLTEAEFEQIKPWLSLYPTAEFNPATAPAAVLATRYDPSIVETLTALQSRNELDGNAFLRVTGLGDDEFTVFYPGPALRVSTERRESQFRLRRETTLVLRPYEGEPVQLWGRRQ